MPDLIDTHKTAKEKLAAELQRRIKGASHSKNTSQFSHITSKTTSTAKGDDPIKGT